MPVWRLSCSGSCVELLKHQLFIGRDDDCDLTIKHKGIDIRHAVLNYDQRLGVFRLTDLGSSNGTFVNGESVGEESVPLYVGTRIMFGKNPNIWCVEVGEAAVKPYIPEPSPQQHTTPHQQGLHIHSVPPSLAPHPDPYSSPSLPPPPLSHSFQTTLPADRNSPAYTPGSCAGKSYFGDPTSLVDRDSSPCLRTNESFLPGNRNSAQISFADRAVSSPLVANSYSRASVESRPETNTVRSPTEYSTAVQESSRDVPTRARTLYGQPSWWGDGSDTFSTPPSHRKYTKLEDTPHSDTSTNPLSVLPFLTPESRYPPKSPECRYPPKSPELRYLPKSPESRNPPKSPESRNPPKSPEKQDQIPSYDNNSEPIQSQDSRDSRSCTKFFISIQPKETTDEPPSLQLDNRAGERENPVSNRPPLVRRGSYEIPSEQLDSSVSRPVIDPEPPSHTPPRGRKSEVFVVELGESKKPSRTEPRVLFSEDKNVAIAGTINTPERLGEREIAKHKVRLAFRETEPTLPTPQLATEPHSGHDLDTDSELEFMSPYAKPPLELQSPRINSFLSDRGEEIGDPVTSSTPISMTSSESQLMSPLAPTQFRPPFKQETRGTPESVQSFQRKARRKAWDIPQQSLDPAVIQTLNDLTHSIEANFNQVYSQARVVHDVLSKHFGGDLNPFSVADPSEDLSDFPELETASQEIVEIVYGLKMIEAKVKNFSKQYGTNVEALQALIKLKTAESGDFDTPEVPTHDKGVIRKGSFETDADPLSHPEITEQLKHLSFPHK